MYYRCLQIVYDKQIIRLAGASIAIVLTDNIKVEYYYYLNIYWTTIYFSDIKILDFYISWHSQFWHILDIKCVILRKISYITMFKDW